MAYNYEQTFLSDNKEDSVVSDISVVSLVTDEDGTNAVLSCGDKSSMDEDEKPRPRRQRSSRTQKRSFVRFNGVRKSRGVGQCRVQENS